MEEEPKDDAEIVPVAVFVELAGRSDGLYGGEAGKLLPTRFSQLLEIQQKLDMIESMYRQRVGVPQ